MLLNEKCYVKHEYRKTANIRPRLGYTESQAFFGGLIQRAEGEGGGLIYETSFMSRVFHNWYLHLKKEEWNKTKKQCPCSKMLLY